MGLGGGCNVRALRFVHGCGLTFMDIDTSSRDSKLKGLLSVIEEIKVR